MGTITVIATVHKENGAADALSLANILRALTPEVIFLETLAPNMEQYFLQGGLESKAIALLSKKQSVDLVPVDIQIMDEAEMVEFRRLFNFLESIMDNAYRSADSRIQESTRSLGFAYLNSQKYIEDQSELESTDEILVQSKGSPDIKDLHRKWKNAHLSRETAMVEKILKYCRGRNFEHAAFLVGAAHLYSLQHYIRENAHLFSDLEWSFGV